MNPPQAKQVLKVKQKKSMEAKKETEEEGCRLKKYRGQRKQKARQMMIPAKGEQKRKLREKLYTGQKKQSPPLMKLKRPSRKKSPMSKGLQICRL